MTGPAEAPVSHALSRLHAELRARGVRAGVGELLTAHRALAAVEASRRQDAEAALRAAVCSRHEDLAAFDAAWRATFGAPGAGLDEALDELGGTAALGIPRVADPDAPGEERDVPLDPVAVPAAWSDAELLRDKDFGALTPDEAERVRALVAQLAVRGPWRRSRRLHRGRGGRLDVRATIRAAGRTHGVPLDLRRRGPVAVQRPLVLVCDVSGSMAPYARMLLTLMQAAVRGRPRVEAFAFGTRLTRLTLALRRGDPDPALRRAMAAAQDWAGGTRIGEALATLNREHGRRLGRGAVVVILSDGWDRGEPELLAAEMARLRRCAHRVIWLNPLAAAPGFEPLARGMAAALPHADVFRSASTLRALEDLVEILERT